MDWKTLKREIAKLCMNGRSNSFPTAITFTKTIFCPIHTSRQEGGVMFGGLTNSTTNHMLLRLYDGKIKNLDFEMQRVIAEM